MARSSLLLAAFTMANAGCLMTSTPQFKAEQHTAPFLVPATALPALGTVVVLDLPFANPTPTKFQFSADVISQDDPSGAFSEVSSLLLIDDGYSMIPGQPYTQLIQGSPLTQPGTLAQTQGRTVQVSWNLGGGLDISAGCHTATLVVSHKFSPSSPACPVCSDDSTQLTWQVLRCDSSTSPGSCDTLALEPPHVCPLQAGTAPITCASTLAEQDAGTSACTDLTSGVSQ